jgi:predicted Fe-Mo cluster-binding NifX family protein
MMKLIAVASEDQRGMQGRVSGHFGRCPSFTLVLVDGNQILSHRVEQNPHSNDHQPGAVPQFIKSLAVDVIIAGGMGLRAVQLFNLSGIDVATGAAGDVQSVIQDYLCGQLSGVVPCHQDH